MKQINLENFCITLQNKLYDEPFYILNTQHVLADEEHKQFTDEMFIFRFVTFNLLLFRESMLKNSNVSAQSLGAIGTNSMLAVLEEKDLTLEKKEEYFDIYIKQLSFLMGLLSTINMGNSENLFEASVSFGITKYFEESFGFQITLDPNGRPVGDKEIFIGSTSMQVIQLVQRFYEQAQRTYQIIDF